MDYVQYKNQIDDWHKIALEAGIKTSCGKPLPITFWKTVLGISRKLHQDLYNQRHKTNGLVSPYIARTMAILSLLPRDILIDELRRCVTEFELDKVS